MLKALKIENFAVIDSVEFELGPGLCVLTGETGAGKTLIVEAIELLLGARADSTKVRTGAEAANIRGVFEHEGREVVIRRRISSTGRSSAWLDGLPVSISELAERTAGFADLLGQHEHQSLLDSTNHIGLLDRFCGVEELASDFSMGYRELEESESRLRRAGEEIERERERVRLREFELRELTEARLDPVEWDTIGARIERIDAAERILERASGAAHLIAEGETNAMDIVSAAEKLLLNISDIVPETKSALQLIESAQIALAEAAREVSAIADSVDMDSEEAESLRSRQLFIERLCRKYNRDVEGLIEYREALEAELTNIEDMESAMEALAEEVESRRENLVEMANDLRAAREKGAPILCRRIIEALAPLGMDNVEFEVRFHRRPDSEGPIRIEGKRYSMLPTGSESAEFLISPNIGEELKPLTSIVSGGELSRIMLAIKSLVGTTDFDGITVLDEVDTGIGGEVGNAVGRELFRLARERQLLVITHLPQIARLADIHFRIVKFEQDGRTRVKLERLSPFERKTEIERMLGGKLEMAENR